MRGAVVLLVLVAAFGWAVLNPERGLLVLVWLVVLGVWNIALNVYEIARLVERATRQPPPGRDPSG